MLKLFCDESYDPGIYTVAGLIASEQQWEKFERRWTGVPQEFGVSRFHASHLNCYGGEFEGWRGTDKGKNFSTRLIKAITQRTMVLVSCSVFRAPYDELPDVARQRLGSPYELCFKHCIALAAEQAIPRLEKDARFSVVYERDTEIGTKPTQIFDLMREDQSWKYRSRLITSAPGSWEDFMPLQPADMVAYETFKLLHNAGWPVVREALRKVLKNTPHIGVCFDKEVLQRILPKVVAQEGTVIVDPSIDD
jgi:hypothetical protein